MKEKPTWHHALTQHKQAEPSRQQQAAAGSSRQQQAERSNKHAEPSASGQNRAQAGRFQQAQIPTGGDRTIQNLNMISFNGHASHGTIDNDTTIQIAINTIQGYKVESCQEYTAHSDETVFKSTASQIKKRTIKI